MPLGNEEGFLSYSHSLPPIAQEASGTTPAEGAQSRPHVPRPVGLWVCFHLRCRIRVQRAGGRQLSAETLMRFGAGRERERADGRLPPPGGAAQGCGGERRVAEGEEPEGRVKGRGAGGGCLRVAVQGGGQGGLIERGLDGGVAPRALETYKTTMHTLLAVTPGQIFCFPKIKEDLTCSYLYLMMTLRGGSSWAAPLLRLLPEAPRAGRGSTRTQGCWRQGGSESDARGCVCTCVHSCWAAGPGEQRARLSLHLAKRPQGCAHVLLRAPECLCPRTAPESSAAFREQLRVPARGTL